MGSQCLLRRALRAPASGLDMKSCRFCPCPVLPSHMFINMGVIHVTVEESSKMDWSVALALNILITRLHRIWQPMELVASGSLHELPHGMLVPRHLPKLDGRAVSFEIES